ncbi:MAG: PAS domain S-box protein [Methanoregula sp.]|nr:PAS domain S-box protein [Methanoregula sp.]
MTVFDQEKVDRLKQILKWHPRGITISDLATKIEMNRNLIAKYLDILLVSGQVEMQIIGAAKVYFLSHRVPISSMLEFSSDLVIILDSALTIIQVNEPLLVQIHETKEALVGRNIKDLDHPFLNAIPVTTPLKGTDSTHHQLGEFVCLFDGKKHYYKAKQLQTAFEDGSQGITLIIEDTTTQITYQKMLELNEAKYRGIVEDQTEFITRFLPDGTLVFVNDAYARYLGKKKEELLVGPHIPDIDQEDIAGVTQSIQSLDIQKPVQSFECRIHHSCGEVRSNLWTVRALFDDTQKPVEFQGVGRDNTEKREAATKINQYIRDMEFISRKAQEFVEISADADIFQAIARGLSELLPGAVVCVNSYDSLNETITVRSFFPDTDRQIISSFLGREYLGFQFKLNSVPASLRTFALNIIREGKIFHTDESLYNFFFQQIPEDICDRIKETLNLGDRYYGIGLIRHGSLFGAVAFSLRKGEALHNSLLIETYIRQASIVLHRRYTDDALKASETKYRGIVEDQTEFVTRFLPDGTLTYVNNSVCRYFQKERAELLGQSIFFLIPQDDKDDLILNLHSLNAQNPVRTVEHRVYDSSGSIRWTQWTNRALFDDNGTIIEYQGVGRDITEQKEAGAKIRQYIAEREFLMQTAMSFMDLKDDENFYQYIADQIHAIAPGQVVAVSSISQSERTITLQSIAGLDAAVIEEFRNLGVYLFGKSFSLDKDPVFEATLQLKYLIEGPRLYNLLFKEFPEEVCTHLENRMGFGKSYVMGFIHDGKIFGSVIIILRPGQELKNKETLQLFLNQVSVALLHNHARQELKAREKLYRSVIKNIQDVFYRSDKEGNLIMASGGWAKMFGYDSLEECIGLNIAEKFYFEPERRNELLDAVYKNGSISDYEIVLKSRDGNPVYVSTNSHLFFDDAGELLGVEGILHDISERRAAAEKLRNNLSQMEFFSRKIQEFIELRPDSDIYYAIGQGLKELLPEGMIIVNNYNRDTGKLTIKALVGDKARATALKYLQSDLTGVSLQVDEPIPENILEGKIYPVQKNFYSILSRNFSQDVSTAIMQELNLGKFYYLSLIWKGSFLGNVTFGLPKGEKLEKIPFIEIYGKAASIVLQRKIAEDSLKGSSCIMPSGSSNPPTGVERALLKHAKNAVSGTINDVSIPDAGDNDSPDHETIKISAIVNQLTLTNALKMAQDYIAILDLSGKCLWANDAMVNAMDAGDYHRLAGRNLALYIAPEYQKIALNSLVEAKKNGHKTVPLMFFSSSGRVPVEVNLSTIHAEDGDISGFLAIARTTDRSNDEKN